MRMRYTLALLGECLALCLGSPFAHGIEKTPSASPLGQQAPGFELRDFQGKKHSLHDFKNSRALVIAFLGTECPLATLYAPRLVRLADRFADQGVAFIGINSNQQDSLSEMARYAKVHAIQFPLLKDVGNVVADLLGAERTPEVFVLDQNRVVRYRGRIDDQYLVGRQRKQPRREDLALALEDVLASRDVAQPETEAPGCHIGRVHDAKPDAAITYTKHIAPLLNRHCVECHRGGEIAPFELTNYADAAAWAETMVEVVDDNRMPPWHASPEYGHFSNDRRMTDDEKKLLADWVRAGTPQGDPKDLPAAPKYADGWRLPRVDQEVYMSEQTFNVPAEGTVDYQKYVVDPGFKEDKWVQGAQCRPGNRGVVHHIIVFFRPPRGDNRSDDDSEGGFLTATAPGAHPLLLEDGLAKRVPAGSKLVFQMHYTPNGSPQQDRSSVGLMFADAKAVRKTVNTMVVETHMIFIPPKAPNYQIETSHTFHQDALVLSLFPHMHVRGKSFRYEATYPDGALEILLDVPRYDFAWQQTYALAEPKLLPKGTRLRCIAHYDNSPENISNPNPNRIVHWGEQTWDEMLMGFLDFTEPDEASQPPKAKPADGRVSLKPSAQVAAPQ